MSRAKPTERVHELNGTNFKLDRKYIGLKAIGKGSYGVVVSATDTTQPGGHRVAIKKITPMAAHTVDAKHVLREIRLMRYLGAHENIISIQDLVAHESDDELYIVMELLDSDLHKVIQSPQELTDAHHKHFMYQLFCGMKYMHQNRIIHRDLKPGNLLVSRDCKLRITDFGLAREKPTSHNDDPDDGIDQPMTEHVVTRWYRPPELMLCPDGLYTYAVDLWSAGCILAELLGRKPLFPGKNFVHQLSLIFDVIGVPPAHEVGHIRNTQAKRFLASQAGKRKMPLNRIFPTASVDAVNLLEELLTFSPEHRLSADAGLIHPYFAGVSNPASATFPPPPIDVDFEFEGENLSKHQLKLLIMEEIESFHHTKRKKSQDSLRSRIESFGGSDQSLSDNEAPQHSYNTITEDQIAESKASNGSQVGNPSIDPPTRRPSISSNHSHGDHKEPLPSPSSKNVAAMERLDSSSAKAMEILSEAKRLIPNSSTSSMVTVANHIPDPHVRQVANNGALHSRLREQSSESLHRLSGRPPRVPQNANRSELQNSTIHPAPAKTTSNRSVGANAMAKHTNSEEHTGVVQTQSSVDLSAAEKNDDQVPRYLAATAASTHRLPGTGATGNDIRPTRRQAARANADHHHHNNHSHAPAKKKQGTVPKSPQFSTMSWQKKGSAQESQPGRAKGDNRRQAK